MSERPDDTMRVGEPGNRTSQHAGVPTWCDDPCCCEPEPRWRAVAEAEPSPAPKQKPTCFPRSRV